MSRSDSRVPVVHTASRRRFLHLAAGASAGIHALLQEALAAEGATPRQGMRTVSGTVIVRRACERRYSGARRRDDCHAPRSASRIRDRP